METLLKSIVVTSSDSDSDVVTLYRWRVAAITDSDIPTIDNVPSVTLSETNLSDGSTPSGTAVSQTETITFTNQSDDGELHDDRRNSTWWGAQSNGLVVELKQTANASGYIRLWLMVYRTRRNQRVHDRISLVLPSANTHVIGSVEPCGWFSEQRS